MATFNLNPSSTVSNTGWTINGGDGTAHGVVSDGSSSSSIRVAAQSRTVIFELDDYSSGGTIDSIRFVVKGFLFNTRSGDCDIQVIIDDGSGGALYTETVTVNFNSYSEETHYGTARTTSDGSSAWTDSDLDSLRLNINSSPEAPPGVSQPNVTEAYIEVTFSTGYGNDVIGIDSGNISKVIGIETANIASVIGIE